MKISIDIDMSPQEARELMGWPDMTQLHEASIAALNEQLKGGNQEVVMSMLKPYLEGSEKAFTFYQKMMQGMADPSQSGKK